MKIGPAAAFHAYNKAAEYTHTPRQAEFRLEEPASRGEHTDRILISSEGTRKAEVDQLTKAIATEVYKPASPERLESLRTAVQNGTYYVATGDLVDAMMSRWFLL